MRWSFEQGKIIRKSWRDRFIFTNVFVYSSGNYFSYSNKNKQIRLRNITDLKIIPITSFSKDKALNFNARANYYKPHLRQIYEIVNNLSSDDNFYGNRKNRLLDWAIKIR